MDKSERKLMLTPCCLDDNAVHHDSLPPLAYDDSQLPNPSVNTSAGQVVLDKQVDCGDQRWDNLWPWTPPWSSTSGPALQMVTPPEAPLIPCGQVQALAPRPAPDTPLLHLAISSGNCETMKMLLVDDDIFIDERDTAGFTALQRAVLLGKSDMVALLLKHGASVTSRNV